jgi:hypothetical protein
MQQLQDGEKSGLLTNFHRPGCHLGLEVYFHLLHLGSILPQQQYKLTTVQNLRHSSSSPNKRAPVLHPTL